MSEEFIRDDNEFEMDMLLMEGYSCAQVMMKLYLELSGRNENDEMIDALAAFSSGLHCGRMCGALIGGALMLAAADSRACKVMIPELIRWFEAEYGSTECSVLGGEYGERRLEFCTPCIHKTYYKTMEIIDRFGIEL